MPFVDRVARNGPLIGPREDAAAGDAALERRLELPVERLGLPQLARVVSTRIDAHLSQHQRPAGRGVLQLCEVAVKRVPRFEKDVEGDEVGLVTVQVLRRGVVGIRDQLLGIRLVHQVRQLFQQRSHGLGPDPADDIGRHLVADADAQHGRIAGDASSQPARRGSRLSAHRPAGAPAVADHVSPVLVAQAREHAQPKLARGVKEVGWRRGIGANHGEARGRHRPQVGLDLGPLGEQGAVSPFLERAVGHASEAEALVSDHEVLPVHPNSMDDGSRCDRRNRNLTKIVSKPSRCRGLYRHLARHIEPRNG